MLDGLLRPHAEDPDRLVADLPSPCVQAHAANLMVLDDGTELRECAIVSQYVADQVPDKKLMPPCGAVIMPHVGLPVNGSG